MSLLAVCLALLVATVHSLGPARIAATVSRAKLGWLLPALLCMAGRYVLWGWKWTRMLRRDAPVGLGYGFVLQALMTGAFVNLTTPTGKMGGGVVRAVLVSRRTGWPLSRAYGSALADQATNVGGDLTILGVLALLAAPTFDDARIGRLLWISGALELATVLAVAFGRGWIWRQLRRPGLLRVLGRVTPKASRAQGEAAWVEPLLQPLLAESWPRLLQDVGLAMGSRLCLLASNALVLRAVGVEAPLPQVSLALVIGYLIGTLGPVGGLGVTEVALVKLYTQIGMSGDVAAAGALLQRAGYYLVSLGWGGVSLLILTRRGAAPLQAAERPPP